MVISVAYHLILHTEYPSSDGLLRAKSGPQRQPLTYVVEALDLYFQKCADVYVGLEAQLRVLQSKGCAGLCPLAFRDDILV
jgi:hypothetical protein